MSTALIPASAPLSQADGHPADRHPVAVYLARLAPGSRRTMRQALDAVAATISAQHPAETLPWPSVGYQHVAAVRAALLERGKAPATVNKTLAAVRGVLRECWRLGLVDAESYQRAADVGGVRATTLPRGRALTGGDLAALMRWCAQDDTARGARNAALLALLYGGGLRRGSATPGSTRRRWRRCRSTAHHDGARAARRGCC